MDDPGAAIEALFRRESGRILAGLIRVSRSFDLAEEALQEAFAVALSRWSTITPQPGLLSPLNAN
jgi:RNA polymerase sigma-70 factor (ECF subfamily)